MTTLSVLRLQFQDESFIGHMTVTAPPVVRQLVKVERNGRTYWEVDEGGSEPPDQNGRSLSGAMVSLIGGVIGTHDSTHCPDCQHNPLLEEQRTNYPPRFPVRRALSEWDRICRRRHRGGLWWDHAEQPICGLMLRDIVEGGASVLWCSDRYGLSYPRADRLIGAGATFVSDRLAKWDDERLGITHDPKTCDICWRSAHETA